MSSETRERGSEGMMMRLLLKRLTNNVSVRLAHQRREVLEVTPIEPLHIERFAVKWTIADAEILPRVAGIVLKFHGESKVQRHSLWEFFWRYHQKSVAHLVSTCITEVHGAFVFQSVEGAR